MWGICVDENLTHKDLFGLVVQYKIDNISKKAVICLPVAGYLYDADKIRALSQAPEHIYPGFSET